MFHHIPVMLNECIQGLLIKSDGIYVDATIGGAGHSSHILKQLSASGHLIGFDQDDAALETARERLSQLSPNFTLIRANFHFMKGELESRSIGFVDGILFDLGVSSPQLDHGERGFSYNHDALLDMRMDRRNLLSAHTIVNTYGEKELSDIIFRFGEERFARSISREITAARTKQPIDTTFQLVDIIKKAIPASARSGTGHPAKRTFQALRIAVNHELDILEESIREAAKLLKVGGRLEIITFHSLEDRIVKEVFKELTSGPIWNKNLPVTLEEKKPLFELVTKKPIVPSEKEILENNRSHSAKLRIIERI